MNNEHKKIRVGVYGIFFNKGKILLIKKSRGPYKGKYDLPGGGIEYGEKIEDALKREIHEETGASVISHKFFNVNENYCQYLNDKKETLEIHQVGLYYVVFLDFKDLKTEADGHDSLGAEEVDIEKINSDNTASIALEVIVNFLKNK